jgi:Kdo2-lipid A phosphotransferase
LSFTLCKERTIDTTLKHSRNFVCLQIIAFALLASWLWQPTRLLWDSLDQKTFFVMNGSLADHHWWQFTLAIANYRPFDLVPFFLMITPFLIPGWVFNHDESAKHLLTLSVLMAFLISARIILSTLLGIHRQSPSLILHPAYLLHELIPYIDAKDKAGGSFPGDHAAVIFSWFIYMWLFAKPSCRLTVLLITLVFSLPRIIGGAHWLSDDLVGGIFLALFSISWICYTPLGEFCVKKLSPLYNFAIRHTMPSLLKRCFNPY